MTEKVNEGRLLDSGLSSKLEVLANPHFIYNKLRARSNVLQVEKPQISRFQEKFLVLILWLTVPRTNTRGQV